MADVEAPDCIGTHGDQGFVQDYLIDVLVSDHPCLEIIPLDPIAFILYDLSQVLDIRACRSQGGQVPAQLPH